MLAMVNPFFPVRCIRQNLPAPTGLTLFKKIAQKIPDMSVKPLQTKSITLI
jgi:hypothetical protein